MMRDEQPRSHEPSRSGAPVDGLPVLEVDPSVLAAHQGDRSVLLAYEKGEYYGLNEIAALSWKMLSAGDQFETIVAAITADYQVTESTARADLTAFLSDLRQRGFVRPVT